MRRLISCALNLDLGSQGWKSLAVKSSQSVSFTGPRSQIRRGLIVRNVEKGKMRGEKPQVYKCVSVYLYAAVVKTELVVPDNRHCNALTLSDLSNSDNVNFALCGQSVTIESR